jgi:hypothetical protein
MRQVSGGAHQAVIEPFLEFRERGDVGAASSSPFPAIAASPSRDSSRSAKSQDLRPLLLKVGYDGFSGGLKQDPKKSLRKKHFYTEKF